MFCSALLWSFGGWGTSVLQPRHVTELSLGSVSPRERGQHLSKGSTGAHGNNRGVMSLVGRACVHEWLRPDTAPLNVTYTLRCIIVSRLWHSPLWTLVLGRLWRAPPLTRPFFDIWTLEVIYSPCTKTAIVPDLFVRKFFSPKLKVSDEMADVDQWYFSKSRCVRKASLSLIP